jgi:hypothetical protein
MASDHVRPPRFAVGDTTAVAARAGVPKFGAMKSETAEPTDQSEMCECGHRASQHDEGEGSCEASGCECEAMEPMPPDSDEVEEDGDEHRAF